jgi:hypothetical protein
MERLAGDASHLNINQLANLPRPKTDGGYGLSR